jgi:hypothetical protein
MVRAPNEHAGKQCKCGKCNTVVDVPLPEAPLEEFSEAGLDELASAQLAAQLAAAPPSTPKAASIPGAPQPLPGGTQIIFGGANMVPSALGIEVANQGKSYSGFSTAGFVLSLIGLFSWFLLIPSILGLIFSCVALSGMNRTRNRQGRGLAIAGLVMGIVGVTGGVLAWLFWFSLFVAALSHM